MIRAPRKLLEAIAQRLPKPLGDLLLRRPLLLPLTLGALCNIPIAALGSEYQLLRWIALVILVLLVIIPIGTVAVKMVLYLIRRLKDRRFRRLLLLNILFALLWAAAYPPLPLGWLSGVLLVPWLWTLRRTTLRDGMTITFVSAWCFSAAMYYWIYHVASVGPPVAVLGGLALLLGYLSLFHLAAGWLFLRLDAVRKVWLFPFVWGGIEAFRAFGEMSFPWEHFGYTLGTHLSLIQSASWIGVYGLSILLVASNLLLLQAIEKRSVKYALFPVMLPLLLFIVGCLRLHFSDDSEDRLNIALLQPNIPQHAKWERANFSQWMDQTWALIEQLPLDSLDLVVLPETAVPAYARHPINGELGAYHPQYLKFLHRAEVSQTEFLVGFLAVEPLAPGEKQGPRRWKIFNSAFRFPGKKGEQVERYDKIRLVPFSERMPWEGLFPMLNYVDFGEGDFTAGTDYFFWGGTAAWSPSICYEVVYPDYMRAQVKQGARLLVNITNDGWFGETTAPYQHANIARFRAVELGTPIARSANTGVSLFFDSYGREYDATPLFQSASIRRSLPLREGMTLYAVLGDWVEPLLLSLFVLLFFWALFTDDFLPSRNLKAIFPPQEDETP